MLSPYLGLAWLLDHILAGKCRPALLGLCPQRSQDRVLHIWALSDDFIRWNGFRRNTYVLKLLSSHFYSLCSRAPFNSSEVIKGIHHLWACLHKQLMVSLRSLAHRQGEALSYLHDIQGAILSFSISSRYEWAVTGEILVSEWKILWQLLSVLRGNSNLQRALATNQGWIEIWQLV